MARLFIVIILLIITSLCLTRPVSSKSEKDLVLPVRVYLMKFDAMPQLNSTYDKTQVNKMFAEINKIWGQWGISWAPEQILPLKISAQEFAGVRKETTRRNFREQLAKLAPPPADKKLWRVAIIRQFPMPAGGVYIPEKRIVFYGELNKNGEERFAVLAHELGHTLGLRHVQDGDNLMMGGKSKDPTKTRFLNPGQIAAARSQALIGPSEGKGQSRMPIGNDTKESGPDSSRRKQIVERMLMFDSNGDGVVSRQEVPPKAYKAFDRIDQDKNNRLDKLELEQFIDDGGGESQDQEVFD